MKKIGPMVGNTHTETSVTGTSMTIAYREAREIIRCHVNAHKDDLLITAESGMTGLINKLQRILGLRIPQGCQMHKIQITPLAPQDRPVVFITHMEHHSNHTSWLETIADVRIVPPGEDGQVSPEALEKLLLEYQDRPLKIGSFTACSNISGIITPYHKLAQVMHRHGGKCIVDFAASGPYVKIDMHPEFMEDGHLDALIISTHKFLGGPGSSGIMAVSKDWYNGSLCPDHPGGGTVDYTNPWGKVIYSANPNVREDGGTPAFLQTIRAAMAVRLKEEMGVENIQRREHEMLNRLLSGLRQIPGLHILDDKVPAAKRICIVSFFVQGAHYNLLVRLLNDRFGIQTRGGCSCAGTYGHFLYDIEEERSLAISKDISNGDLSTKPGWVRVSCSPVMKNSQVDYIVSAVSQCVANYSQWSMDYEYNPHSNEYEPVRNDKLVEWKVKSWFRFEGDGIFSS